MGNVICNTVDTKKTPNSNDNINEVLKQKLDSLTSMNDKKTDKNYNDDHPNDDTVEEITSLPQLCDRVYKMIEIISTEQLLVKSMNNTQMLTKMADIPKILLVGTQTSGKSTLLNNIIGRDILPTGDNMVTRTPFHISLRYNQHERIILFHIENGKKIVMYDKEIKNFDQEVFKSKIIDLTDLLTGGKYLISKTPIFIEISASNLFDLTFVDLPGLVTLAITDKGQPETMVDDIKELIEEQLSSNNAFVIVVMQSKKDLETDVGLGIVKGLCKKYNKMKTLGVFTKADLLDKKTIPNFDSLFTPDISSQVSLDCGYYVVNNNLPAEFQDKEKQYIWYGNFFGKKSNLFSQKRYGIHNVIDAMKKHINIFLINRSPAIKENVMMIQKSLKDSMPFIGNEASNTKSKTLYIINNCFNLSNDVKESINSTGSHNNIGSQIRHILDMYEKELTDIDPYGKNSFSDTNLKAVINSFEGFSQSNKNVNLIIQKCFTDVESTPVNKIKDAYNSCLTKLYNLFTSNLDDSLKSPHFSSSKKNFYRTNLLSYSKIVEFIVKTNTDTLTRLRTNCFSILDNYIDMQLIQKIWYDENDISKIIDDNIENPYEDGSLSVLQNVDVLSKSLPIPKRKPRQAVLGLYDDPIYNINQIRLLLNIIYKKFISSIKELSLKTTYSSFISTYETGFFHDILQKLNEIGDMDDLFYSSSETRKNAKKIEKYLEETNVCIKYIDSIEKII